MHRSYLRGLGVFAVSAVGVALAAALAGLLAGWSRSDGMLRYPTAERLTTTHFRLESLAKGYVSQYGAYRTPNDLPQVLGWYAQEFGLSHAEAQADDCMTMTRLDARLFLQHSLGVTVCGRTRGTLIFVNRSLALRRP
jgi:hypothetical protein